MIRLSVFGVIAFLAYVVGVVRNASSMVHPYQNGLKVVTQSGPDTMPLQYLFVFALVMHFLLAARLYFNAWIVDENDAFRKAMNDRSWPMRVGEWLLRLVWVAGMAWLPDHYGRAVGGKPTVFGFGGHSYLVMLAICLLMWDLSVKGTILGYTQKDVSDLRKNWLRLDALLVPILAVPWITESPLIGPVFGNWGAVMLPTSFIVGCIVSGYQLVLWGPYAFKPDTLVKKIDLGVVGA